MMSSLGSKMPIVLLRLMALGAIAAALILMVTARESTQVLNMTFKADFKNSPSFKYFVGVNAVAAVYTFIALFSSSASSHFFLVLDLVITLLLDSGLSACLAESEVGKNGNTHAGWLPICGQVPKFCDHVKGALISGFVASIIYFLLLLYSLHTVLRSKA